ncbi:MAG: hypothetical protein ACYCZ0_04950 [Minisyncoccota bacterium]
MKKTSARLAVVFAALVALTIPRVTNAAGPTPEWTVLEIARITKLLREKQSEHCPNPRTKTPTECIADFEAIYPVWAEAGAWQVLLLRYPAKAGQYRPERDRHHKHAVDLMKKVEGSYFPLSKVSEARK